MMAKKVAKNFIFFFTTLLIFSTKKSNAQPCQALDDNHEIANCIFPFQYNGVTYNGCVPRGINGLNPECAITVKADGQNTAGKWGTCYSHQCPRECHALNLNNEMVNCIFPFELEGLNYTGCTQRHSDGGHYQCRVSMDAEGTVETWGSCFDQHCSRECETTSATGRKPCIFPFKDEDGIEYSHCTPMHSKDHKLQECAVEVDKKSMKVTEWGECTDSCLRECKSLDPSSQQGRPHYPLVSRMPQARQTFLPQCVFPFTFKNVTHTTCTTNHSANGWPWCATEVEESAPWNVIEGKWADCDLISCNYAKRIPPPELLAEVRTNK